MNIWKEAVKQNLTFKVEGIGGEVLPQRLCTLRCETLQDTYESLMKVMKAFKEEEVELFWLKEGESSSESKEKNIVQLKMNILRELIEEKMKEKEMNDNRKQIEKKAKEKLADIHDVRKEKELLRYKNMSEEELLKLEQEELAKLK